MEPFLLEKTFEVEFPEYFSGRLRGNCQSFIYLKKKKKKKNLNNTTGESWGAPGASAAAAPKPCSGLQTGSMAVQHHIVNLRTQAALA